MIVDNFLFICNRSNTTIQCDGLQRDLNVINLYVLNGQDLVILKLKNGIGLVLIMMENGLINNMKKKRFNNSGLSILEALVSTANCGYWFYWNFSNGWFFSSFY